MIEAVDDTSNSGINEFVFLFMMNIGTQAKVKYYFLMKLKFTQ